VNRWIAPIVEGQSEVQSVPLLLRRMLVQEGASGVEVLRPFRVKRNKIVREGELERTLKLVQRIRPEMGGVLLLLDADDSPPDALTHDLQERCQKTLPAVPVSVTLAVREFECWLLAAKESLRGYRGIREDARAPSEPDAVRDGKGSLSRNMHSGRRYMAVDDQPALAAQMNLRRAEERSPSFARFVAAVRALAAALTEHH